MGSLFSLLALPALYASFDLVTLSRTRLTKYPKRYDYKIINTDFSVLIPIFGNVKYLKNVEFLAPYGNKVILCTTDKEAPEFYKQLEAVASRYGFRIYKSTVEQASRYHTNPWRLFRGTLHNTEAKVMAEIARDEIIRDSFEAVSSDICIFLDGDTISPTKLDVLVAVFERSQLDLASVRVLPGNRSKTIERLQGLEYAMAMDCRRLYPWLTSGASMIAKTSSMRQVMANHSLFFQGGDIEIGKLATLLKLKVGHIPFVFYTEAPASFKAWYRQRTAWCAGGFRHAIINFNRHSWRYPLFFIYNTLLVYSFTPLRWYMVITRPLVIPLVICFYWLLLGVFYHKRWQWCYLLYPLYSLIQVMVIVPHGALRYARMAASSRNPGLIKLRGNPKTDIELSNG